RVITLSLRVAGRIPELWNPVNGETQTAGEWKIQNGRTVLPLKLDANGSVFIALRKPAMSASVRKHKNWPTVEPVLKLKDTWKIQFDTTYGGPAKPVVFNKPESWSRNANPAIKYYSGTASYSEVINWHGNSKANRVCLDLGKIANIAVVYVNGTNCGTAWTYPYRVNIANALKSGKNTIRIDVSNTWANRLIGDHALRENKRITWTNAPYRLDGEPLLPAGLLGQVRIVELKY
ncbi:MAG: DNA-binding protein, partial [Bacteroidetes bacterium]|nr:DNA-binding protein [Bacteroidota bacterium]